MKHYLGPVFVFAALAILACTSAQAETGEKMVVALATDDFELAETDISTLAVGEAQTIETESGKIIDILRTADGAEIYIDGELLEVNLGDDVRHEDKRVNKQVEITCDDEGECHEKVTLLSGDENESLHRLAQDGENIVIHKEIRMMCNDEEDGGSCIDEDIDIETFHDELENGDGHKLIVIKKAPVTKD